MTEQEQKLQDELKVLQEQNNKLKKELEEANKKLDNSEVDLSKYVSQEVFSERLNTKNERIKELEAIVNNFNTEQNSINKNKILESLKGLGFNSKFEKYINFTENTTENLEKFKKENPEFFKLNIPNFNSGSGTNSSQNNQPNDSNNGNDNQEEEKDPQQQKIENLYNKMHNSN